MSDSLRPHGLYHAKPPCPSPTLGVYSNTCPLSRWYHPTISSSLIPFSWPYSFSNGSALLIRWPKYWSFSFNISPSNEHPGLISFRMDWLDLLAVQGTLKSLLQHHSSKASILRCSAFFIVQLSHPYMTTGKTIALTGQTFVGKVPRFLNPCLNVSFLTRPPRALHLKLHPSRAGSFLFSPRHLRLGMKHKIHSLTRWSRHGLSLGACPHPHIPLISRHPGTSKKAEALEQHRAHNASGSIHLF